MATIELRDLNPAEFNNNLIVYGKAGVGSSSPLGKFEVNTGSDLAWFTRTAGDAGTSAAAFAVGADSSKVVTRAYGDGIAFELAGTGGTASEKVRFSSNGSVGIGTTSPSQKLEVVSSANGGSIPIVVSNKDTSAGTNQNVSLGFGLSRNSGTFKDRAGKIQVGRELDWTSDDANIDSFMAFYTYKNNAEAEKMRIDSDGKVGIGTTSPVRVLELSADTNSTVNLFRLTNADTTYSQTVDFSLDTNKDLVIAGASGNGGIHFNMGSRGYFFSNGNVGIGTTSPSEKLSVSSGNILIDNGKAYRGKNTSGTVRSLLTLYTDNKLYVQSPSETVFQTNTDSSTVNAMAIDSSGKVGIGTTSPSDLLQLSASSPVIRGHDTDGGSAKINFGSGNITLDADFAAGESSSLINFKVDGTERMRIASDGNVGINETSPTEKLHVNGNLKVTGDVLIGSTATSITEVGPYDPYVLYHWSGRTYQNGGSSDIMFFNGDALYYADADSPWNKSSVAAANPESLTTLVGGATFNRTYQTRDWYWHHMIRLDNTTKTDSAMPTKYMRIKMPVYYTAGASEHHVFYFQVLNDRQSGFQLCVCNSSGTPVKRAAVQHKNGGGWATYGSYQRGPNNSVANQSSGYYGEWTNSLIMGSHIDDYSFADSDSPTGRSIYLSINCNTANSNNYIYFMGFAIGKNKKGIAITTPRIIVNGANDPARGKVNLYGNGLRHHNNWYWSEMVMIHQQHASTTPIQIAGTDKDIIINFMNTCHSNHEFDKVTLFLTDKDSNQRYDGSGGGNFGWDSHVPNQWVNAGLMNIGSFTGNGADKWVGYAHRGGISLSWIIKKELLQALAYDVDGITNLRVGFGNVNNHWRHGYIRGIATEQINS